MVKNRGGWDESRVGERYRLHAATHQEIESSITVNRKKIKLLGIWERHDCHGETEATSKHTGTVKDSRGHTYM